MQQTLQVIGEDFRGGMVEGKYPGDRIIVRKSDGALFRASHNYSNDGEALAGMFKKGPNYFFRRVKRRRKLFIGLIPRWEWFDTGEVWEPDEGEFHVLSFPDFSKVC